MFSIFFATFAVTLLLYRYEDKTQPYILDGMAYRFCLRYFARFLQQG